MQWKTINPRVELSVEQQQAKLKCWHTYFAWLPHQLITGNTAWLERIARRVKKFKYIFNMDIEAWEYTSRIDAAVDVFTDTNSS